MRGALKGYLFFGYKRIMAQVPYFAVPFGIGYAIVSLPVCLRRSPPARRQD